MNPFQQFLTDVKRGFRKGEDIMTSDQVYRHSIFDKAYYDQTRKGYEGKAKVGFTDRAGRTIGRGKKKLVQCVCVDLFLYHAIMLIIVL